MDEPTLERVLRSAEQLIGERGFYRVALEEIASDAGVQEAELSAEFGRIEDLLVRLASVRGHELRSHLHQAVEGLSSRAMMEGAGFDAFFAWLAQHPLMYRILRQLELVDREAFRAWYRDLASDYTRGLVRAMDEGEIKSVDAETLAWCLMGMGDFMGMRYIMWEERTELPKDIARTFQRLVTRMLTGSGSGR